MVESVDRNVDMFQELEQSASHWGLQTTSRRVGATEGLVELFDSGITI
jgi:hypothetical protein